MDVRVIHRHVCNSDDFYEVREWCERIIGPYGWNTSMEFELPDSRFNSVIKAVIVIYDTVDKPLEQIKVLLALRWA